MKKNIHFASLFILIIMSSIVLNGCTNSIKEQWLSNKNAITPMGTNADTFTTQTSTMAGISTVQPSVIKSVSPTLVNGLQLTYVSIVRDISFDDPGFVNVYGIDIGCLDKDDPCIGEPSLLFEKNFLILKLDWSPGGKRVVYETLGNIYISDFNGNNVMQILGLPGNYSNPRWSPNGKMIAYIYTPEHDTAQVQIYNVDNGQIQSVLKDAISPKLIYWLSNDQLAYVSNISRTDSLHSQITIANSNGTILKKIPENYMDFQDLSDLAFSPNGKQVIFSAERRGRKSRTDLLSTNLDNNSVIDLPINKDNIDSLFPVWSPIGDKVAYVADHGGNTDIYVMNPDGTHVKKVSQGTKSTFPAWRWKQ
jgi:hypothetical protein